MSDYRVIDGDEPFDAVGGKRLFESQVLSKHSRGIDVYNLLSRDNTARSEFLAAYGCRCGYCGVSKRLEPMTGFQVDHYIPQSKGGTNELNNLVASCRRCNNLKRDFCPSTSDMARALHPDGGLEDAFTREEDYRIAVNEMFSADPDVVELHGKLHLGADFRRLDYLAESLMALVDVLYAMADSGRLDWVVHSKCTHAAEVLRTRRNEVCAHR